jgi:hypothetical protein
MDKPLIDPEVTGTEDLVLNFLAHSCLTDGSAIREAVSSKVSGSIPG